MNRKRKEQAGVEGLMLLLGDWQAVRQEWEQTILRFLGDEPQEHQITTFDGTVVPEGEVVAVLRSPGLFGGKRVILYRNPPFLSVSNGDANSTGDGSMLLNWLESGKAKDGQLLLAIHIEKPDRRRKIYRKFADLSPVVVDRILGSGTRPGRLDPRLADLIKDTLAAHGKRFHGRAMELFLEKVGSVSSSAVINELEKLIYFTGDLKVIQQDHVESLVARHREEELFRLSDNIKKGDLFQSLKSLDLLLTQEVHPLAILAVLRGLFERLLSIRFFLDSRAMPQKARPLDFEGFKAEMMPGLLSFYPEEGSPLLTGKGKPIHPYALWLDYRAAFRFQSQQLSSIISRLCDLDMEFKGGRVEPRILLEALLLEIISSVEGHYE